MSRGCQFYLPVGLAVSALIALGTLMNGCDRPRDMEGTKFNPIKGGVSRSAPAGAEAGGTDDEVADCDIDAGRALFTFSCVTCHGANGQGMPHSGASLRTSPFVASHSNAQLVEFLRSGRPITDPNNKSGVLMPARGGNVSLSDNRLADIVGFLRLLQQEARQDNPATPDLSNQQQASATPISSPEGH